MSKGRIASLIVAILGVLILIAYGVLWGVYSHFAVWCFDPTSLIDLLSLMYPVCEKYC